MKCQKTIFVTFALAIALFISCSTQKDSAISRNWHALHTKYNVLYHGNIAFEEGRADLNSGYRDNYWETLPIERLETTEDIKLDSEGNTPNFLLAEEKATKAVQKHSMDIKDRERNPQTDEAFLLLGKARYFDQRYIPALEAFNYILLKYTRSDKLNEAAIWREKTNMRLDNPELAIKNLKRLFKIESLEDQEYADANAVLAQCYIRLNAPDSAIQKLRLAQAYTLKNTEKGRYRFIIGQLYDQLGQKDSANKAYEQVIDLHRKTPWIYNINAHLRKIRNTDFTAVDKEIFLEYLTRLEKNWENRYFVDEIYREIARFHLAHEADSIALVYYDKSLQAGRDDRQLKALNYQDLANYYFGRDAYETAGRYYDSTLTCLEENSKRYRSIKKKLDNLEDVIRYEGMVQYADSIITLYQMPMAERQTYFTDYIAKLKLREETTAEKERQRAASDFEISNVTKRAGVTNAFYFYNDNSLEYGKNTFKTRWGDRERIDNWRWSSIAGARYVAAAVSPSNPRESAPQDAERNLKYRLDFYLDQIPTAPTVIDSIKAQKNFANYQLGLIYKEKLKDYALATAKLNLVLAAQPEERLVVPAKYNLYKIYKETQNSLAEDLKQDILTRHSDSRYAGILINPQAATEEYTTHPDAVYAALYKLYEQQQFIEVLNQSDAYIDTLTGDPIVPKLELLRAQTIGRLQGWDALQKALNYVALTYPNHPEGKKATQLLAEQLPKWKNSDFAEEVETSGTGNWKVAFPFSVTDREKAIRLMERLEEILEELEYTNSISQDIYTASSLFVVVHGFPSKDFALGFAELIKNNKDYRVTDENFVVLSNNYKTIQIHKNLDAYIVHLLTQKL